MKPEIVVLDRDGVINHDSPAYIKSPAEWRAIDGSIEAIAELHRAGYPVYIATNQAGVARGHFDVDMLDAIHERLLAQVKAAGGDIAGIFYCPHHPEANCECRKPKPGLLLQIAERAGVAPSREVYVGDSLKDIEAAHAAGCEPILVLTGNGRKTLAALTRPVRVFDDLAAYAKDLLAP